MKRLLTSACPDPIGRRTQGATRATPCTTTHSLVLAVLVHVAVLVLILVILVLAVQHNVRVAVRLRLAVVLLLRSVACGTPTLAGAAATGGLAASCDSGPAALTACAMESRGMGWLH